MVIEWQFDRNGTGGESSHRIPDHRPIDSHCGYATPDGGDIVQAAVTSPGHAVTAYHPKHGFQRRIPAPVEPFSSPVVGVGGAWLCRFESEGLYDTYCAPHHVPGMTVRNRRRGPRRVRRAGLRGHVHGVDDGEVSFDERLDDVPRVTVGHTCP